MPSGSSSVPASHRPAVALVLLVVATTAALGTSTSCLELSAAAAAAGSINQAAASPSQQAVTYVHAALTGSPGSDTEPAACHTARRSSRHMCACACRPVSINQSESTNQSSKGIAAAGSTRFATQWLLPITVLPQPCVMMPLVVDDRLWSMTACGGMLLLLPAGMQARPRATAGRLQ